MDKEKLKQIMSEAKLSDMDICVELTMPECIVTECIIVKNRNIDYKMNYYDKNYTEDLKLERCPDIKIVDVYPILWER